MILTWTLKCENCGKKFDGTVIYNEQTEKTTIVRNICEDCNREKIMKEAFEEFMSED
jgi:DNA-directed RNA polymerase subunit RPC12/RpoP